MGVEAAMNVIMEEKTYHSQAGSIHYWVSRKEFHAPWLVFLPGLTADHRLFKQQIAYFQDTCNCLVWDAPAHGKSRPFALTFTLHDIAVYLHDILQQEQIMQPVLLGQSMGGYVAQAYLACYPDEAAGIISIDSAPLAREYYAPWELWCLKHTKGMYRSIPWKLLVQWSAAGNAETAYGRSLMREIMLDYTAESFSALAGHGFRILAEAVERWDGKEPQCPVLLLCGEHDQAGFVKRYNKAWTKRTGYPLVWIPDAGHIANTDNPDAVNAQIAHFLQFIEK